MLFVNWNQKGGSSRILFLFSVKHDVHRPNGKRAASGRVLTCLIFGSVGILSECLGPRVQTTQALSRETSLAGGINTRAVEWLASLLFMLELLFSSKASIPASGLGKQETPVYALRS